MCRFREIHSKIKSYRILLRSVFGEIKRSIYSKHSQTWRRPRIAFDKIRHLSKSNHSQAYSFAYEEKIVDYYLDIESQVLRNLTMAKFVQGDKLFVTFHELKRQRESHLEYTDFDEAIMCRICWSTRDSMISCARFNRGIWTNHRFEICIGKIHILNLDCS